MNINKRLKPNLLDPKCKIKITRTLNPPREDYWKPTKNVLQTIYADYIRPNFYFFLCLGIFFVFLMYRYRVIQNQRLEEQFNLTQDTKVESNENIITYSDIALNIYNQQKEKSVEPRVNTDIPNNRVKWAPIKEVEPIGPIGSIGPQFAYPIFPYAKGGRLVPPTPR